MERRLPYAALPLILACFSISPAGAQDGVVTISKGPETPSELVASIVKGEDGRYYVFDNQDREVFEIDDASIVAASEESSDAVIDQVDLALAPSLSGQFIRESAASGSLRVSRDRDVTLSLRSATGQTLIGARFLDEIGGTYYILQEELDTSRTDLEVRRFVVSHDGTAGLVVAELDVGDIELLDDSFIAIMDGSTAMYLAERNGEISIAYVAIDSEVAISSDGPDNDELELAIPGPRDDFDSEGFGNRVRELNPDSVSLDLRLPLTRERAIANAREFRDVEWRVNEANYARERAAACRVPDDVWRRPGKVLNSMGKIVTGLPYKWGGYTSAERFISHMDEGRLAGDSCTCRDPEYDYCIVPEASGIDCSGFVSQVWEIDYHTTSNLSAVATPIAWDDLKPGDALNKPGSHVRLFVGFEDQDELLVRVIESAVSCGGVCERVLSAARFSGYQPIRLNSMVD